MTIYRGGVWVEQWLGEGEVRWSWRFGGEVIMEACLGVKEEGSKITDNSKFLPEKKSYNKLKISFYLKIYKI